MKKTIFISILITSFFFLIENANAQFSVQAGVVNYTGDLSINSGFGGALSYDFKIGPGMTVGPSVGYFNFSGRYRDASILPVLVTFEKSFSALYTGLDAGVNFIDLYSPSEQLVIVPKIGGKIQNFSLEMRYNISTHKYPFDFIGILVGYSF